MSEEGELEQEANIRNFRIVRSASRQRCSCDFWRRTGRTASMAKRIDDNALKAIALLIAESRPDENDVLTRVVVNLIKRRNA